jgi:hypothetical protein
MGVADSRNFEQVVRGLAGAAMTLRARRDGGVEARCDEAARLLEALDAADLDDGLLDTFQASYRTAMDEFGRMGSAGRRLALASARLSLLLLYYPVSFTEVASPAVRLGELGEFLAGLRVERPEVVSGDVSLYKVTPGRIWKLGCPNCGADLYYAYHDREEVAGGGQWLRDGDTVPYLNEELSDSRQRIGHDYELLVGARACCGRKYFVVECCLLDKEFGGVKEAAFYFEEHKYPDGPTYVAAYTGGVKGVPAHWLVTAVEGPGGVIWRHVFGPLVVEDGFSGPAGVVGSPRTSAHWRGAADLLKAVWDDMSALAREGSAARV